ncbi:MAG: HAD hydrolase family protein [Lachnospiraceae bacterium]|nr:HAD hydrolase family protein [Lachnospiraceae bacterium]
MKEKTFHLPHIGMRMTKSCIAVFLCYLIYLLRGRQGMVFYSQLAVLWCIQPYVDTSLKKALQRTTGTFVGAFFGLIVVLLNFYIFKGDSSYELLQYAIISIMIIPIIQTTLLLHKKDASYFSCVVFLSIVVNHIGDINPFLFVWSRVVDTMIGILIGILVNSFHLPHKKRLDLLFISGLDETLLATGESLSSYSKIELNQLLDDGVHFTISTMRTPASLIEPLKDIKLNLPVIAMNGAVLYDINEKKYLKSYVISYNKTCELLDFIHRFGHQCFINVIMEDILVIYHQDLQNDTEKDIYSRMYSSPYRNYLYGTLPEGSNCIYLMTIDVTEKIELLYNALKKNGYTDQLKVLQYPSTDYPGYSYLKIYNRNAGEENMIKYLQATLHCSETITFGNIEGKYDYIVSPDNPDLVVRHIKKLFKPFGFNL